jgi:hypothetical protein
MKQCSKCNKIKPLEDFTNDKTKKDGKYSSCKICKANLDRRYNNKNQTEKKNRDHLYYKNNSDKIKSKTKKWYIDNHEHCINVKKEWYKKNFDKVKELKQQYKEKDPEKWTNYMKIYQRERYRNNIQYRIKTILNKRIRDYVQSKRMRTLDILGCSIEFFMEWIQYQFDNSMSWDNQGSYWDFDHVTPCTSFDLEKQSDVLTCYHWSNLRPCEKRANISKSNKIVPDIIIKQSNLAATFKSLYI